MKFFKTEEEKNIKEENKNILKLIDKKTSNKVFINLIIAVLIMAYFCGLAIVYNNVNQDGIINIIKVSTGIFLIIDLILIELAYKKESKRLLIHVFEIFALAVHSLTTMYIIKIYKIDFKNYILVSSYIFSIYYVLKTILINTKARKEYIKDLSDISDIVKKEEPIKKEASKKEKKNKKQEKADKKKEFKEIKKKDKQIDEENNEEEILENKNIDNKIEKEENKEEKYNNKKLADIREKLRQLQKQDEERRKNNQEINKDNKEKEESVTEEIIIQEDNIEAIKEDKQIEKVKDKDKKKTTKKSTTTTKKKTVKTANKKEKEVKDETVKDKKEDQINTEPPKRKRGRPRKEEVKIND